MINQSIELNESILTLETQLMNEKQKPKHGLCSSKTPAVLLCGEKGCKHNAFLCEKQSCACKEQHKDCLNVTIDSIIKKCEAKKVPLKSFQSLINDTIQKVIDELSEFREKTIIKLREQFQFLGLNAEQKKFIEVLNYNKLQQIQTLTGNEIWQIIFSTNFQKQNLYMKNLAEISLQSFQRILFYMKKSVNKLNQRINMQFNDIKVKQKIILNSQIQFSLQFNNQNIVIRPQKLFSSSKIITSYIQLKTLEKFFKPKMIVKSTYLLYRASQNEYKIGKFHQKCDGIPNTLVIVETQFSKKIGGFTPIEWGNSGGYVEDESYKSFLFSLSNGDKFDVIDEQKAVQHQEHYGFSFGRYDFYIRNDSYTKQQCCIDINYSYVNQKYQKEDINTNKALYGKQDGKFRVKQWQVWGLQIQVKD